MITANDIKERIAEMCSHFTFEYRGKSCGVDPIYRPNDNISIFDMWYGEEIYEAKSVDEVMTIPLFGGKSLNDIADEIDIIDF